MRYAWPGIERRPIHKRIECPSWHVFFLNLISLKISAVYWLSCFFTSERSLLLIREFAVRYHIVVCLRLKVEGQTAVAIHSGTLDEIFCCNR
jgi:hypothetical protein